MNNSRRALLSGAALALLAPPLNALAQAPRYAMSVWRDPGCGCCGAWSTLMQRSGRSSVAMRDAPAGLKRRLGVPEDLVSCHTAEIQGYVIEGHVPADDILRLLTARPRGVRGLAVAGMPAGSPGMEAGGRRDAFDVVAFNRDGSRSVFAHYPART